MTFSLEVAKVRKHRPESWKSYPSAEGGQTVESLRRVKKSKSVKNSKKDTLLRFSQFNEAKISLF